MDSEILIKKQGKRMDWKTKCLVCMKLPGRIPIFGPHGREENIERMLADFLDITVQESDGPPEYICERCYDILLRANDLKECARRSTQKLELLQVEDSDGSPEYICERCYDTLLRANDPIECARRSTQKLELLQIFEEDDRAEAELESREEAASKPAPWKSYVDDDILFGRITTSCDLKEFKKHIPFVKLERVDDPEWHVKWPQFPESQVPVQQHFTLDGPDIFEH